MNYGLFAKFILFLTLFCVPFLLIIIKNILKNIYDNLDGNLSSDIRILKNNLWEKYKYDCSSDEKLSLAPKEEVAKLKKWTKRQGKYYNRFLFLNKFDFMENIGYAIYCVLSIVVALFASAAILVAICNFNSQKKLLDNNFKCITQFYPEDTSEKELMTFDMFQFFKRAEAVEEKYFDVNGSPNKDEFMFILPENYEHLKPIDMNYWWTRLLNYNNEEDRNNIREYFD